MGVDRVELRSVTVPPATTQANPFIHDISFQTAEVLAIEIVIPDGHAALTGLAIMQTQQIVIPWSGNVWITSNNETIKWPYKDYLRNGSWQVAAYNADNFNPHTFFLRFLCDSKSPLPNRVASPPLPLDILAAQAGGTVIVG